MFQPIQGLGDEPRREAARGELALELETAVLAARQERDRPALAIDRIVA